MLHVRSAPGLTFDDVLLVPRHSHVYSRGETSTATRLTTHIPMALPVISANMDTVTEWQMAVAMARAGGIGIIHRFMGAESEAEQVRRAKRAESHVVDAPLSVAPQATVRHARQVMARRGIGGLVVTLEDGKPAGNPYMSRPAICGRRPAGQRGDDAGERLVTAPVGTTLEQARRDPGLAPPRETAAGRRRGPAGRADHDQGYRACAPASWVHQGSEGAAAGRGRGGSAAGLPGAGRPAGRGGLDVLVVDVAHGHADGAIEAVRAIRRQCGEAVDIIAGNVATADGTLELIDAVRQRREGGRRPWLDLHHPHRHRASACRNSPRSPIAPRQPASMAFPSLPTVGIRNSGDMVKALAAGASSVMVGSLLAGTDESPGVVVMRNNRPTKVSRGMASLGRDHGSARSGAAGWRR